MRLPRNLSGGQLGRAMARLGYGLVRQKGSHMRYTTSQGGTHHVTIPDLARSKPARCTGYPRMWRRIMA